MIESTVSISLLKRLTILPIGVTSKNDIGKCMSLSNKLLCNLLDAFIDPLAIP